MRSETVSILQDPHLTDLRSHANPPSFRATFVSWFGRFCYELQVVCIKKRLLSEAADANSETLLKKIGYPDKWRDYAALQIDRTSYLTNDLRAGTFQATGRGALEKLDLDP